MLEKIKISIIIPVYNTSKYLEKCLNSVINQSLKEIEIICVNDGSTDNSLDILKEFQKKDERIIIIDKENKGVSSARNAALKIAKGKYCLNIDSDDWIEQDFFKIMFYKAEKENLDLLVSNIILDYDNKSEIEEELAINNNVISGKEYAEIFFNKKFIAEGYTCNKLIKTKVYIENNIYYTENISFLEDYELILKLAFYLKRVGKLNKAYYHYIQRKTSTSNSIKNDEKNFFQGVEVFNNLETFYKDKDKNIYTRLKREKIFSMQYFIFKTEVISERVYIKFLSEIKKEKFILNKKSGENLKQIILLDIVKIFNSIKIIKIIKNYIVKFF